MIEHQPYDSFTARHAKGYVRKAFEQFFESRDKYGWTEWKAANQAIAFVEESLDSGVRCGLSASKEE